MKKTSSPKTSKSRSRRSDAPSKINPKKAASKPLNKADKRYLRSLAHALKPVVRLGQHGLTAAVTKELEGALAHHELVKVKLSVSDKQSRLDQVDALCLAAKAECIQQIGHTATLFRRNTRKPVIDLKLAR